MVLASFFSPPIDDPYPHDGRSRRGGLEAEAVREGERAVKLQPISADALEGPAKVFELALTQTILGNHPEACEALGEIVTSQSGMVSIPALEADPRFDTLRQAPCYKTLIEKFG